MNPAPVPPKNLNPFARELLERLSGHEDAAGIVIGGGVALSHYLEYRGTVDLDAWWLGEPNETTITLVEKHMREMGTLLGLEYRRRRWGETESLELLRGGRKEFSFQISRRTLYLDAALPAKWQPVSIETLRDNVASKMTALVERGAPRDLKDIYHLCHCGLVTVEECWQLWKVKNPQHESPVGPKLVRFHIERLELQRPLANVAPADRDAARALRAWYRDVFCKSTP
jgi:hypothetical protein